MKKILITGAAGFIGSFLVEEAQKNGYEVYAGIRKTSNTKYLQKDLIHLLELDLSQTEALTKTIEQYPRFDYIIHNAGITKAHKKEDFFTSNYQYTKTFIEILIEKNKVPQKFIYMSSLAAFGPGDTFQSDPILLTDAPRPLTAYGKSKLQAEQFIASVKNFPYLIIRPTAVYGPREKDLYTLIQLLNKNIEISIGNQKQQLSFIYVKDLASIVMKAMGSSMMNTAYFVSDGNSYTQRNLVYHIKSQLQKRTFKLHIPLGLLKIMGMASEMMTYFTQKPALLNREKIKEIQAVNWRCDIQTLIDDLQFEPHYTLQRGIQETIAWYQENAWLK